MMMNIRYGAELSLFFKTSSRLLGITTTTATAVATTTTTTTTTPNTTICIITILLLLFVQLLLPFYCCNCVLPVSYKTDILCYVVISLTTSKLVKLTRAERCAR